MPIIKSAKKRVRVAQKNTVRNVKTKRSVRSALKAFQSAVSGGKKTAEAQAKAQSELDKAVKKGVIHKNKAARQKKQLARKAGKPVATKKAAAPKKTATKKAAPAKKPATKKPAAKKTTKK